MVTLDLRQGLGKYVLLEAVDYTNLHLVGSASSWLEASKLVCTHYTKSFPATSVQLYVADLSTITDL